MNLDPNITAWTILMLPLVVAAVILLGVKKWSNISAYLSTGSALATLILTISLMRSGMEKAIEITPFQWINLGDKFNVEIGFKLDEQAVGMMFIVTAIGFLVHLFSLAYMNTDGGKSRYFASLALFMFSMTGIVFANNFVMMFIFWELVGVSSYLLISHWFTKASAAEAAKKAFLTNRIGDFGFMIGILLIWVLTQSIYFDEIKQAIGGVTNVTLLNIAVICVFCGAIGKSAQAPLHIWLPDAMEGPTPVSALIHAATMVAAGVFMLARISFLVLEAEVAAAVITWVGAITALLAALMALQQDDIKRVLAFSTLSQLGYMVMAQGLDHGGSTAGMFHLYTHAFFKALLFLGSGAIIYACHHQQNIWKMGGLSKKMPITFITFLVGTAALIAVPLLSGFWSKEKILEIALKEEAWHVYVIGLIVAVLTPFYMTRLFIVTFFGKPRTKDADHAKEVNPVMLFPLIVLAVLSIISAYKPISGWLLAPKGVTLGDLHFNLTTGLSLAALIVGAGLAILIYRGRDKDPINIPLFARKFYIDEIYIGLVRIFQDAVGGVLDVFDRFVIDPIVARFPALGALSAGSFLRIFQTGNLQSYAFYFGVAILALILFLIL
ncbi:MAG: NADH-quinone oxidoreductase subunit L [Verrucomicrobiota bacterium]